MMDAEVVCSLDSFTGTAKLWKLSKSIKVVNWLEQEFTVEYVITSAVIGYNGRETFVFPANKDGKVVDWGELEGSLRGHLDHDAAICGFLNAN